MRLPGPDEAVTVIALSNVAPPEYLCVRDPATMEWHPAKDVIVS